MSTTDDGFAYVGGELSVFALAKRWKAYVASQLGPFLTGRVLEVGAGIGATTLALWRPSVKAWTALEPDATLAGHARNLYVESGLVSVDLRQGTLEALAPSEIFDTILYIDVLEHIEDDRAELRRASGHLAAGGHLIVLAPAHLWLYSPFDAAIGHHRRYNAATLGDVVPQPLTRERVRYLDAFGVAASLANRMLLRRPLPAAGQLLFWDRVMVPASRLLDPCLGYSLGRSILGVWRGPSSGS